MDPGTLPGMKTSLFASIIVVGLGAAQAAGAASAPLSLPVNAAAAASATAPEPDAAVLAQLTQAVRDGRFGAAYKRGLKASPASPTRDRVLALEDDIVAGVFARIAARRLDLAEATAVATFYASPDGQALTSAQLSADGSASSIAPAQRDAIAAFFASPPGRKFNALLADPAVRGELQLALAFIAGPGKK